MRPLTAATIEAQNMFPNDMLKDTVIVSSLSPTQT